MSSVAQIEFFLPSSSLPKITVRVSDVGGRLFQLTGQLSALKRRQEQCFKSVEKRELSYVRRLLVNCRSKRIARQILHTEDLLHAQTKKIMRLVLQEWEPLALEKRDRTFRYAEWHDVQSFTAVAQKSTGVWVFLFAGNDLLAEKNRLIASSL